MQHAVTSLVYDGFHYISFIIDFLNLDSDEKISAVDFKYNYEKL